VKLNGARPKMLEFVGSCVFGREVVGSSDEDGALELVDRPAEQQPDKRRA